MEETITLKEGTGEESILVVSTPVEISLEDLKTKRDAELGQLANLKDLTRQSKEKVAELNATIAKAEEVVAEAEK